MTSTPPAPPASAALLGAALFLLAPFAHADGPTVTGAPRPAQAGDFALKLTHPRYGVRKKYRVTITGEVTPEIASALTKGVYHEGDVLKAEQVRVLKAAQGHSLVELTLREGKNREVRRLFETQALTVDKLQRTQIGPIKLGELPKGKWRTLTAAEIKSLLSPAQ